MQLNKRVRMFLKGVGGGGGSFKPLEKWKCPAAAAGRPCEWGESCAACFWDGTVIWCRFPSPPGQVWPRCRRSTLVQYWVTDLADYSLVKNIIWSMKIQWNKKSLHHLSLCSWLLPGRSAGVHRCPIMQQQTSSKPPTLYLLPESCHRYIPIPFTNVTEAKPFLKFTFKRFGSFKKQWILWLHTSC